jgi:hypothetical protein
MANRDIRETIINIIAGMFIFFFILLMFASYIQRWFIGDEQKYTIGTIMDFKVGGKSSPNLIFTYTVNEQKHTGSEGTYRFNSLKPIYKKRFYVGFNPKHTGYSRMFLDYPVPDNIHSAPFEGWDSIPYVGRLANPVTRWVDISPPIIK